MQIWWAAVALLAAGSAIATSEHHLKSKTDLKSAKPTPKADGDVFASLEDNQLKLPRFDRYQDLEIYSKAQSLLTNLKHAPSCVRSAAQSLLSSCSELQLHGQKDDDISANPLEAVKSIFAARIAVCELSDASADVPQACSALHHEAKHSGVDAKRRLQADNARQHGLARVSEQDLSACLRSLESRPQWWTSYSNGRQNAVIMCQAVRADIEKEELLEVHKWMVDISSQLHTALADALEETSDFVQDQNEFLAAMKNVQSDLMASFGKVDDISAGWLAKTSASVDELLEKMQNNFARSETTVLDKASELSQQLGDTSAQLQQIDHSAARLFQGMLANTAELAALQQSNWQDSHKSAVIMMAQLDEIKQQYSTNLLTTFTALQSNLVSANLASAQLQERQSDLDNRMQTLDDHFAQIESRTESLTMSQNLQQESQLQLLDSLRNDLTSAQSVLMEMANSAETLHTAVKDSTSRFQELSNYTMQSPMMLSMSWWVLASVVVCLLGGANARWICLALGAFVFFSSINMSSLLRWVVLLVAQDSLRLNPEALQSNQLKLINMLAIVCLTLIICLCVFACIYQLLSRRRQPRIEAAPVGERA